MCRSVASQPRPAGASTFFVIRSSSAIVHALRPLSPDLGVLLRSPSRWRRCEHLFKLGEKSPGGAENQDEKTKSRRVRGPSSGWWFWEGDLSGLLLGAHGGVVLLEALGQALRHGHLFLDAARDAALLARGQRLGREVVDARDEAVVNEVAEELFTHVATCRRFVSQYP